MCSGWIPAAGSWPIPALVLLRGTSLGSRDFAMFSPSPNRFAFSRGQMVPLAKEGWRATPMEQQFDALLYLGGQEVGARRAEPDRNVR